MISKIFKFLVAFFLILVVFFSVSCNNDNTAPVLTILGDNPQLHCIDFINDTLIYYDYIDPGATAIDEEDGDITNEIRTTINVNTTLQGTYSVVYIVEDKAGNNATATRTVNVDFCK